MIRSIVLIFGTMMDYRYLAAFRIAAETLNFARAAEKLNIAPSALTRQIHLFEESVGQECFARVGRSVRLNDFGEALFRRVVDFESQHRAVSNRAAKTLRIGALQSICESLLTGLIAESGDMLCANITIDVGSPAYLREQLLSGRVDAVLTTGAWAQEGVRAVRVGRERLAIVSRDERNFASPQSAPWIVYTPLEHAWNKLLPKACSPSRVIRTNSFNTAIELAAAGAGLALVVDGKSVQRRGLSKMATARTLSEEILLTTLVSKLPSSALRVFERALLDLA